MQRVSRKLFILLKEHTNKMPNLTQLIPAKPYELFVLA